MGAFAAGQVVIVRFPFSDLTASKLRPAVVLADAGRGDWIL
jgi:mRNA interferase MazF